MNKNNNLTSVQQFSLLRDTINIISTSVYGKYFVIKGGSALMSRVIENNRLDLMRKTSDIDIHCDKKEIWISFCKDVVEILNNNNLGHTYSLISKRSDKRGLDTSDSLVFKLVTNYGLVFDFKMDMNIKSNLIIAVEYSPLLNMQIYDFNTMLSDKIIVVSSQKVYRRIKDLYDIGVITSLYDINYMTLLTALYKKHPDVKLINMMKSENYEQLFHAYNLFVGIDNKPEFNYLFYLVTNFLTPFYGGSCQNLVWKKGDCKWYQC